MAGLMVNLVNAVVKSSVGGGLNSTTSKVTLALAVMKKVMGGGFAALFAWYLAFLMKYKFLQSRKKLPWPPGPTPLPGIGSLHLVGSKMDTNGNPLVHLALMDLAKTYRDGIYGIWLGASYTVVITKPSVAEEAFMTHALESGYTPRGDLTTDRASNQSHGGHHVPSMYIMTRDGKGIAMSCGPYHRKVRGRLVAHVTSKKIAEAQAFMVAEEVESCICNWKGKIERGEKLDNLTSQLKRESMNMGMRLLFGKRFGAHEPQDFKDLKFCVEYFFCNLSSGNPSDMIPALRMLPNKFLREMERVTHLRDRVLGNLIGEHRREFDELRAQGKMESRSQARGMIDQFFFDQIEGFEAKDEKTGKLVRQYLTEDETHVCVWDILFAMTDTTATTNEWLIYHMINNPNIQRKVHEELDRVVGQDRLPNLDDRENLPYLWAVLKEVMRFRIVSPVMAPHYANEDLTLHDTNGKEFFVPRGAAIFLHGYSMGLDPELWDNPEEFNPDRWFSARNEGLDLYGQVKRKNVEHYKFIPFSLGARMCPGYSFAKVAQFLQSAMLMQAFRYRMAPDALKIAPDQIVDGRLSMEETWGLTIMPQRHGENGLVCAEIRPAAHLSRPQPGDIDYGYKFLKRDVRQKVKLVVKEPLSHDTALLRFALPDRKMVLGLPCGKHFKIFMPNLAGVEAGQWNGREDPEATKNEVERAYTPTSSDENVGHVDLVVKFYRPGEVPRFPDGGKVSQQLDKLLIDDEIEIMGPFGRIEYCGKSMFKIGKNIVKKTMVGMMAGGSGITPMYQILKKALSDPDDDTLFSLIYANQTEQDILIREELESLARANADRFKIWYTLDRPEPEWKYSTGFIDEEMIKTHMPPVTDETLVLMCGPPPMIKFACRENLDKLGYPKESQVQF